MYINSRKLIQAKTLLQTQLFNTCLMIQDCENTDTDTTELHYTKRMLQNVIDSLDTVCDYVICNSIDTIDTAEL